MRAGRVTWWGGVGEGVDVFFAFYKRSGFIFSHFLWPCRGANVPSKSFSYLSLQDVTELLLDYWIPDRSITSVHPYFNKIQIEEQYLWNNLYIHISSVDSEQLIMVLLKTTI